MDGNINSTNENIETLSVNRLYINDEKIGCMFMSGHNHTENKSKWEWQ
jgi:hypothetical protein